MRARSDGRPTPSVLVLALAALLGCAPGAPAEGPFQARFTVRGRWPSTPDLSWRIEPGSGPVPSAELAAAIREALAAWSATGCARFRPAPEGTMPDVLFAWRRGAHDACPAFGADPAVAHAGPVAPGTFVHFDAARAWGPELSLAQAALHEVGHVLGLDHSSDPDAVMNPEPSPRRARLAPSDLAGIHALYGGGAASPGDLVIHGAHASLVLPAVAPPGISAWTLFDTDGDGRAEILVWRTDRAGSGALMSYRFTTGPCLERTVGPAWGVSAPGFALECLVTDAGERLLVLEPERGEARARVFDDQGTLAPYGGEIPPGAGPIGGGPAQADLDGDGVAERVELRP